MSSADTPLPQVRLKIERRSSHPWVFDRMVEGARGRVPNGSVVDVLDRAGTWVGRGFYNSHSRIALRILTDNPNEAIDEAFFHRRITAALELRRNLLKLDDVTDAYRLVFSEADGLSGLIVDRFAHMLVVEFFAAGMFRARKAILDALKQHFPAAEVYYFAEEHVGKQESFDCHAPPPPTPFEITEHGLKFRVAPGSKHKTGFFADQRDNRLSLARYCAGKRVLDLCCNSGGFGIYAQAKGQAGETIGVDLDETVLELAKQNAKLNKAEVRFVQADIFSWLRDIRPNGELFDVVILDPAKMTRDRDDILMALKKYHDMNKLAMMVLKPGGIFLTCSCTGLVPESDFLEMLRRAAWQAGRQVQILQISGAAADHPFLGHVPEGRYLKAVFARVL